MLTTYSAAQNPLAGASILLGFALVLGLLGSNLALLCEPSTYRCEWKMHHGSEAFKGAMKCELVVGVCREALAAMTCRRLLGTGVSSYYLQPNCCYMWDLLSAEAH